MPRDKTGKNRKFGHHKDKQIDHVSEEDLLKMMSLKDKKQPVQEDEESENEDSEKEESSPEEKKVENSSPDGSPFKKAILPKKDKKIEKKIEKKEIIPEKKEDITYSDSGSDISLEIKNPNKAKANQNELKKGVEITSKLKNQINEEKNERKEMKNLKAGKTAQAKADLARLEEIRKKREEAAKEREEEKKKKEELIQKEKEKVIKKYKI